MGTCSFQCLSSVTKQQCLWGLSQFACFACRGRITPDCLAKSLFNPRPVPCIENQVRCSHGRRLPGPCSVFCALNNFNLRNHRCLSLCPLCLQDHHHSLCVLLFPIKRKTNEKEYLDLCLLTAMSTLQPFRYLGMTFHGLFSFRPQFYFFPDLF